MAQNAASTAATSRDGRGDLEELVGRELATAVVREAWERVRAAEKKIRELERKLEAMNVWAFHAETAEQIAREEEARSAAMEERLESALCRVRDLQNTLLAQRAENEERVKEARSQRNYSEASH